MVDALLAHVRLAVVISAMSCRELRLKLGLTVSPRTVRRYMPHPPVLCENSADAGSLKIVTNAVV